MLASSASQPSEAVEQLIEGCLQGDQHAWNVIVTRYWRKVFNVAYKFVGRHDQAEDLAQEIFLKIFKALGTFDRRANFQTWLISVSRNLCIDHYRSVRKEREMVDRSVDAADVSPCCCVTSRSCHTRRSPTNWRCPKAPSNHGSTVGGRSVRISSGA